MNENDGCFDAIDAVLGVLIATVLMIPMLLFDGWVLSVLWHWLVPPVFPGLPHHMSVLHAAGLGLLVAVLTHQYVDTKTDRTVTEGVLIATFTNLLIGFAALAMAAFIVGVR